MMNVCVHLPSASRSSAQTSSGTLSGKRLSSSATHSSVSFSDQLIAAFAEPPATTPDVATFTVFSVSLPVGLSADQVQFSVAPAASGYGNDSPAQSPPSVTAPGGVSTSLIDVIDAATPNG